jgi:hypothetical protein
MKRSPRSGAAVATTPALGAMVLSACGAGSTNSWEWGIEPVDFERWYPSDSPPRGLQGQRLAPGTAAKFEFWPAVPNDGNPVSENRCALTDVTLGGPCDASRSIRARAVAGNVRCTSSAPLAFRDSTGRHQGSVRVSAVRDLQGKSSPTTIVLSPAP